LVAPNLALKMPAKMIVKIAIITSGVSSVQKNPSTDPR
jgi:hypothetical protein